MCLLGAILNRSNTATAVQNFRAHVNFVKEWKSGSFAAIANEDIRKTGATSNSNTVYGYNDDYLTVDNTGPNPNYNGGYSSYIGNGLAFSKRQDNFVSFFGNGAYTYLERYISYMPSFYYILKNYDSKK